MPKLSNVVLIVADDLGFSDLSCYGGEIDTPSLDRLAREGTRMTQFYNTARCSPSRASLLTGLHPHQVGVGILTDDDGPEGYPGNLSENCVTLAEILRESGYATHLSGKWHLTSRPDSPNSAWPTRRGFDGYFGQMMGGTYFRPVLLARNEARVPVDELPADYYYTDAITDSSIEFLRRHRRERAGQPFFLYAAHYAPHWPLQARAGDIAKYKGRFDAGWEQLRLRRLRRLIEEGILCEDSGLSDPDPLVENWAAVDHPEWEARRMEVYAAQVDRMDRGIGRLMEELERLGELDDTIVLFLSDNGGCAEEFPPELADEQPSLFTNLVPEFTRDGEKVVIGSHPTVMPGPEATYQSYGRAWANLSNTPFREYKHWVHEGGISSPFIARWPNGQIDAGRICTTPVQLTDIMPTLLAATGGRYPRVRDGHDVPPMEGRSFLQDLRGEPAMHDRRLFWEHEGNSATRDGRWKLVRRFGQPWELYDIETDRAERHDLSAEHPEIVADLSAAYDSWARRCGVVPYDRILGLYERTRSSS